ncbi:SMI1/KNR4 family protein [Streptomyces sp. C]|uniref:SMI1/KNR4 family protein n=1 Tax=Streptomyces sp. C TaxID=253839 RepID=UPI0032209CB7
MFSRTTNRRPPLSSLHDFATWEPVLRRLRAANPEVLADPGGYVAGHIWRSGGCTMPWRRRQTRIDQTRSDPLQILQELQALEADLEGVRKAMADLGLEGVSFKAEISPAGRAVVHVLNPGPASDSCAAITGDGALVLVEGAVAEPRRRLPRPTPDAVPAPSADPELLARTLRERLPAAVGATEAEIAAAEERLGLTLPEELKALYRVTRVRSAEGDDEHETYAAYEAVGCELGSLDQLCFADVASRPADWDTAARTALFTPPDAPVQGLVGSPGWLVFAGSGYGDPIAVDLTPGPGGHTGQIVLIDHEKHIGAVLLADSLTDLVASRGRYRPVTQAAEAPALARIHTGAPDGVPAAAHPDLEVLDISRRQGGTPISLGPFAALPRLRTLTAAPHTLADPLEVAGLTALEFLALASADWRVLLDAGAVPRSLLAAGIVRRDEDPLAVTDLANELLALRNRPLITRTTVEGDLGPTEEQWA